MEKSKKRALRLVLNDYQASYGDLLNEVNRPAFYVSQMKTIATEMFKSVEKTSFPVFRKICSHIEMNHMNWEPGVVVGVGGWGGNLSLYSQLYPQRVLD